MGRVLTINSFYSDILNNSRNIYVYLPDDYYKEKVSYPVLYAHDGQNIFSDTSNSLSGDSWSMDNVADSLIQSGQIRKIIIVGISNNSDRAGEYSHYSCKDRAPNGSSNFGYTLSVEGAGKLYERFIIEELKPYIDSNFRTLAGREDTAMLGSSMGGMVTYNIGFNRPDVFSKLAVMSPAFFWETDEEIFNIKPCDNKVWIDSGDGESIYVGLMTKSCNYLRQLGYEYGKNLLCYEDSNAIHSEKDWGARVYMPLIFFFGDLGQPSEIKLLANKNAGKNVVNQHVNAQVTYTSGVKCSYYAPFFTSDNESVLTVLDDGKMVIGKDGEAKISFSLGCLTAEKTFKVNNSLSNEVTIDAEVAVPINTPFDTECIYLGMYTMPPIKLDRVGKMQFAGKFKCDRNQLLSFKIKRKLFGFAEPDKAVEKRLDGKNAPLRHIFTDKDVKVKYTVEKWGDLL